MQTVEVKAVYVDTESRDGKKFKSPRFTLLTDDGQRYSTFDSTIGRLLEDSKGKLVDVDIKENGGFKNIEAAAPHTNGGSNASTLRPPASSRSSTSTRSAARDPTDSRMIVRQVALKCAVELVAAKVIPMELCKATADKFVLWIYEQSEVRRMTPEGEEV